jgi:hypothetical protein
MWRISIGKHVITPLAQLIFSNPKILNKKAQVGQL